MRERRDLTERIESGLIWVAAFAFACGLFLSLTLTFKHLPETSPAAVGYVTINHVSKLADYLGLFLSLTLIPLLTILLRERLSGIVLAAQQRMRWHHQAGRRFDTLIAALLTVPLLASPIFYLTTGKVGWILLLPAALAAAGPALLRMWHSHRAAREFFAPVTWPYHALLFAEALSWILFRYIATTKRIAHYPTLSLELVFIAGLLAIFWGGAFLIVRLATLLSGADGAAIFRRLTFGGLPLVLLPFIALVVVPVQWPRALVGGVLLLVLVLTVSIRRPPQPRVVWALAAFVIFPALVYLISYASTAHPAQWIDLFHRGESIGPASDYLRGKAPYRDVFVLHGMLEDGVLDAWLMQLFGRSLAVAVWRTVLLGGMLGVSLWYLGIALFRSMPLAMVVVAMGAWTTAENNRTFFQVAAVALFWWGFRHSRRAALFISGTIAAITLFFSYDIGVYTIAGGIAACLLVAIASQRSAWEGMRPLAAALWFVAGIATGAVPFIAYLASRGGLAAFAQQSFVQIPAIIDAVWSLPFPDLVSPFRGNVGADVIADFVFREKFHLILTPLTLGIAVVYLLRRWWLRSLSSFDYALMVLTVFAAVAQRTAFGRAEFRHQYFAAFLVGPIIVMEIALVLRAMKAMWRDGNTGERSFVALIALAILPPFALMFWIPDLVNYRIDETARYVPRVSGAVRDGRAEEIVNRVDAVSQEITRLTRTNETIYDFSNQPAFYFFANRPNATRFYQVPIASPQQFQAEVLRDLQRARPRVVIRTSPENYDTFDGVPNALRAQAVSAYIDDCYRFYKSVRGVELWTRRTDARPATVASYLKRIHMPKPAEMRGSGSRLVFPAVGSLPGVGGAYWVSELTLHNPSRDPLVLSLRYIAGDTRIDRHITLASRQTMRWPDVVKTFFGAPESLGSLWLEHPQGRAPVAVVKTWDIASGGHPAIETALGPDDAVSAGGDGAELTVVGIPAMREGRRINVGIVNTGIIPATFRVTARTRTGAAIGKPIEQGIPEDEIWLIRDIELVLGVKIDENTTVRLTPIAGTGVGFATIVDPAGSNEFIAAIPTQQQP